MASASEELQKVIYDRLVADAAVGAIVDDRIYDGSPEFPTFPYVSFGPTDYYEDDEECITGRVETFQIDCWSRDGGRKRPAKVLADAVKSALHDAEVELTANALHSLRVVRVQVMDNPDPLQAHGIVSVEARVEEV